MEEEREEQRMGMGWRQNRIFDIAELFKRKEGCGQYCLYLYI